MSKNKVLIIDDESSIREMLNEILSIEDYDVIAAANGQEALEILDYWVPDVILCDIMMPVMDGFLFYEIVNENKSLCAIPFVFLTAKRDHETMQECMLNGVDAFLSKPFKIEDLKKVLKNKIQRFVQIKNANTNLYTGEKKYFSHEVNTPLNGILGVVNLLLKNHDRLDKNEIVDFYNCIKISGERLNRTMQNLFLYQRIIENKFYFEEIESCNILSVFSKVTDNIFYIYETAPARISFEIESLDLKISSTYLSFILFELIDNALKFSGDNKVFISGNSFNNKYYEVVISDRGIGFSEEELKRIDAGKQFNREKREQQGLGLGLFLSKTITKKVNGVFSIVSEENVGTKIVLFFPLQDEDM
ncbi:hybrid sensor histidine kinase/response regulator [Flavobacterium sp. KS-LB2]|uniref:hybrid sensor histidine kinase/response regulator n=1 Tax=Flavobacterium sp. KS-LB2 TaxID=3120525 RepID=UPI0030D4D668